MEKRHINRNRRLAAAVATMALAGLAYNANATLTIDLAVDPSGPPGTKTATGTLATPITLDVWATITGANAAPEGLQSIDLAFKSTGPILGTFAALNQNGWTANGSQPGTQIDLDSDTDLDLGSNNTALAAGWWIDRSGSVKVGGWDGAVTNSSGQFLLGKVTFTPLSGSGPTNLQVTIRNVFDGALWFEDATSSAGTGSSPPTVWSGDKNPTTGTASVGAPVVLNVGAVGIADRWGDAPYDGGILWSTASNWDNGAVPASGATVTLGTAPGIAAPTTINLDSPRTVGGLILDNANSYTIGGTSTLTVNAGSTLSVVSGSHTISAPLSGSGAVTKSGTGAIAVSGTQTWAVGSTLTVTAGTFNHNSNSGTEVNFAVGDGFPDTGDEIPATANLSVNVTTGRYNVNASQNLKSLTMATNRSVSNGGTADGTGSNRIQIGNNQRVHVYDNGTNDATDPSRGAAETLWRAGQAGYYDDVNWNGGDGSGTIGGGEFGDGIFLTGVTNTAINGLGMAQVGDGNNFENTLEMREMLLGDSNGDNSVDGSDAGIFASFFGNAPGGFGYAHYTWMEGDYNGDLAVDGADAGIFASNFGSAFNPANGPTPSGVSAVPEPASLGLLAIGAVGLLRRRRKA